MTKIPVPTPHIGAADPGDLAETVLLPGDPRRAEHLARSYLEDVRLVSEVRNMLAFTGLYKGTQISVMGTGMGIPSTCIVAEELVQGYGVRNLVRIGTCGAVREDVKVGDVVLGQGACTDSRVNRIRFSDHDYAPIADFELLRRFHEMAGRMEIPVKVGNLFSSDLFYNPRPEVYELMAAYGVLGVEMEAAGLYAVAAQHGARALAICTVSDHILAKEYMTSDERETSLDSMIRLTLEACL